MKKKLDVRDLKPGMCVAELDRPWLETPFLFRPFRIQSQAEIEELTRYCDYVFIDTRDRHANKERAAVHAQELEFEFLRKAAQPQPHQAYTDSATLEEELEPAQESYRQGSDLVAALMDDARLGKHLNVAGAKKAVADIVHSVIRNPDALVCLAQLQDKSTYNSLHSLRVSILALVFGRHLGLPADKLQTLGLGALLHDVGKTRVPQALLHKPERLTPAEFELMKRHVSLGAAMLQQYPALPSIVPYIAAHHHERYDGRGYIRGLKALHINQFTRIVTIADCYDAIISDRPYSQGVSAHQALKRLYAGKGKEFDPCLVEQFIQCFGIYPIGSLVELNTGHVGVVLSINRERYLRPKIALVLDADKSPYPVATAVDLDTHLSDDRDNPWEIKLVLRPGTYGIQPLDFLPQVQAIDYREPVTA